MARKSPSDTKVGSARRSGAVTAPAPPIGLETPVRARSAAHVRVSTPPGPVRIGILGLGTVAAGVITVLHRNRADIEQKVGRPIDVARVLVRDAAKPRSVALPPGRITTRPDDILADPDIDIVVEAMGGTGLAKDFLLRALRSGKTVVTANKDIMAEHGREVWAAAEAGGADVFFEASVGGGIPIVRALKQSLAGNAIHRVVGILNGTTNFILTRMTAEGTTLAAALAEAQAKGYAEADPSADIDGLDAARKLCILSSIAYSSRCRPADVYTEGIRDVRPADIAHAARLGATLKLLAISELRNGRVSMRVHPAFVPQSHPLAAVHDAFNAIYVQGDAIGEAMFYGRGAGSLPTASAVVGDLMDAARAQGTGVRATDCTCFHKRPIDRIGTTVARYYVRLLVPDRTGVLAKIAGVFGRNAVSILSVLQSPISQDEPGPVPPDPEGERAELIIVTHEVREDQLQRAIAGLHRLDAVAGVSAVIRLAPEDL